MRKTFVTTDGATLSYIDTGSGPLLVLLPGWSQSADMFRHQVEHFRDRYRVVALDFRGHGLSPDVQHGYRIYRFAADVRELFDHANIQKANVVGWSMGASVLWGYFDLFGSDRLDKLVFLDEPASVMRQPGMTEDRAANAGALFDAATMVGIAEQIIGADGHATRGAFLDSMITKNIPDDLKAWLLSENLRVSPRQVAALFVDHCSIDWSEIFQRIDRPTLVVGGRVSHVSPRSQEWIHGQVRNSELVIFEEEAGGAHFPFIESPQSFNPVLKRFLEA